MKKFLCLVLTLALTLINGTALCEGFPLETMFTREPIWKLKQNLLRPNSLELRDVGLIGLEIDSKWYAFFVIRYVAENRMGGYSDNIAFALSTQSYSNLSDYEVVMSIGYDGEATFGSNSQMHSHLQQAIFEYTCNQQSWETDKNWRDLPIDVITRYVNEYVPTADHWSSTAYSSNNDNDPTPTPKPNGTWTCSCGSYATGNFCSECGSKRTEDIPTPKPTATPKPTLQATATPKPTPTATPEPTYKPLKQGNKGDDVLNMKKRLQELGYFTAGATFSNQYNRTTTERVKLFQKVNGLKQTGVADEATLQLLFSDDAKKNPN